MTCLIGTIHGVHKVLLDSRQAHAIHGKQTLITKNLPAIGRLVLNKWRGWDLNPRHKAYEPPVLTLMQSYRSVFTFQRPQTGE
jgi:hypothetical protein